ncbi:MAG: TOBE domain-containing protein, partial [Planctomycetota bacterium]
PLNKFVAGFIGSPPMNFVEGRLSRADGALRFESEDLSLTLPDEVSRAVSDHAGKAVYLGIRPEDVHDGAFFTEADPDNVKSLHTEVVEPLGAETLVYLRGPSWAQDIVAKFDSRSDPRVNEVTRVAFDSRKVHLFDRDSEESLTYAARYRAEM